MSDLRIEATRGDLVESVHRVSAAVATPEGTLLASAGDPARRTFWRSAAKPFQALPMVEDGAADAYGLGAQELALACASHSSEPPHLAVVDRFLAKIGCGEADLACGPHVPLGPAVAARVTREGTTLTPRWSNCSGKHAGLLALARHHGWPLDGYTRAGHPVQDRILDTVTTWTGRPRSAIGLGVDGCTALCFALDLLGMATAWARFGATDYPPAVRLRAACEAHPDLIAGPGRLCTDLMRAAPGLVVAKVGAEGVYCAALPARALGIALKVEDGDETCAPVALRAVLAQLAGATGGEGIPAEAALGELAPPIVNTRGDIVGALRPMGRLHCVDAIRDERVIVPWNPTLT